MVEKAILKMKIKRAGGNFSTVMSRRTKSAEAVSVLKYAAKKANLEQKKLVTAKS